jgi:hypothetical protein
MRLTKRLLAAAAAGLVTIGVCTLPGAPASAAPDPASGPFKVVDPQNWENPDDMTTADFKAPPGTDWANPSTRGSVRNFNIALVTLDYPDEPFVITQKARSTVFGNPQPSVSGLSKDAVPGFYRDLLNKPQTLNGGHTMHEYWMEDSGGRYGVDLTSFGVYTLPSKSYQYGITNDMNPGMCPPGDTCNKNIRTDGLSLWRNAVGAEEAAKYELVFILSAG